jgi:hypothetical protein
MCPRPALRQMALPLGVTWNRFFIPLWVFNFGMTTHPGAKSNHP